MNYLWWKLIIFGWGCFAIVIAVFVITAKAAKRVQVRIDDYEKRMEDNKEIGDLNSDNVNEKDFLEALYAYLYILKSADFKFVNSLTNKLLELNNLK